MSGELHDCPVLTVVVPVYKVKEEYLRECLDSIGAQTFTDYELIIVDDGADDATRKVIDEYAAKDARIRVLSENNSGVATARNYALNNTRGKYVTFIDSDDTVREDNFEKIIERAERDDVDILMWGMYRCFPGRRIPFSPYLADIDIFTLERLKEVQYKTLVGTLPSYTAPASIDAAGSACAKLYKTEFLNSNSLRYVPGLRRAEDMLFNLMAFSKAGRVGYLYDFFYYYRQLDTSATYLYRENGIQVFTDTLRQMRLFLDGIEADEEYMQVYYMRCMFFLLESMDMDYNNPANAKSFRDRRNGLKSVSESDPYKESIDKLKLNNLVFTRKIPLILLRCKMYTVLMIFYKVYGKLKGQK